jgi:hypothetical protein
MKTKIEALQAVRDSYRYTLYTREGNRWVKYSRGFAGSLDRETISRLPNEVFSAFAAYQGTALGHAVLWDGWRAENVRDERDERRVVVERRVHHTSSGAVAAGIVMGAIVNEFLKG